MSQVQPILVTGAGGFIGSHLVESLVHTGHHVKALVRYNSRNHAGWLDTLDSDIKQSIEVVAGDIRDTDFIQTIAQGCELIFHLAALIAIPYSYYAPRSYVQTNIEGTLNILQAALKQGAKVVHTSTSEVYGSARYVPIDEEHPLQGQSPYSASKIGADMMAESFFRSFGLPVAIIRPFNTFGPRQSARAVIPTMISQIISDKPTIELGDLSPTRDLNYVQNTVDAFLCMGSSEAAIGQVIHFGFGKEISIETLAQTLMRLTGINKPIVSTEERKRPANSEVERLCCNAKKAEQLLGWKPVVSLEEGLKKTIDWLHENQDGYHPDRYTI